MILEIVEDGRGRMLDEVLLEPSSDSITQFDRDHFRGAGNGFARGHLEQKAIGGQQDHSLAPSLSTSETKSVASWKRRYTLAKRT